MTKFLRILGSSPPLLALALLLLGRTAQAQVDTYSFAASTSTFTPVSASATPVNGLLGDDQLSGPITIFPFTFDGTVFNSVQASSNGFLTFAATPVANGTTVWTNDLGGLSLNNHPLIASYWDDLDARTVGSAASYETTGTAPNRVFTFEWLNTNCYNSGTINNPAAYSFQVKLYETTNVIQTIYRRESGSVVGATGGGSIGLVGAGSGPSEFLSLTNSTATPGTSSTVANNALAFPATGQVYTFTPAPPTDCPNARGVTVTNITGINAQLNFRTAATATGGYSVVVTPLNGTPGAPQTVTTSPYALTGLSVNSTYTVCVTPLCATGTATPVCTTFTTSNGYCVTGSGTTVLGGTCGGNDVTNVTLIGSTLSATNLTCNSPVSGTAYTQYAATAPFTGTLQQGSTYTLNVTTSGNSIISVWIDYNHDLNFSASEWTQVATTTTAGTAASVNITIPTSPTGGIVNGPTGMRIRSRANGNPNGAGDACTQFFSGETKDFTVNIIPPPACPAVALSSLSATSVGTATATLNFTPVAGGTGTYSVVYGPQGFNPATGGTTVPNATSPVSVTGLQPGTVYQFYVLRDCGSVGTSVLVGPVSFTTTILNNDPCGATPLTMGLGGCVPFATTLVGATATTGIPAPAGCVFGANPRDVWFTFTTSASGFGSTDARIVVSGQAAGGMQVLSAAACTGPFTAIRCIGGSATSAAPALDVTGLTPNTTYYVRVYAYSPAVALGSFSICVTPLPSCPTPTGVTATSITKSGATLVWTSGTAPTGSTYTITYGPLGFNPNQGGTSVTGVTGSGFQLTSLLPLTNYQFYIQLNCGGINGNSTRVGPVNFQTLQEAPANDDPCTAQTLTAGAAPVTGSTVGATNSQQPGIVVPACAPAPAPNDVWYSVTMPPATVGTDSLVLNLNGGTVGQVRIFTAASCSAGPFVLVSCFAATGSNTGFPNALSVGQLTPGTTYYIAVSGYGASDTPGPFTIGANAIYVGPPCNPVTALAASGITQSTANIAFTPGAFNTTYTVTYGPTGGTSTTIPTTTPALTALTGLTPLTNYTVTINPICANGGSAGGTTFTFDTTAPICEPITNLTVTNPGLDSLRVTFTPGPGNTTYVITYSPAGSTTTPTTLTTTSSSVLLTSLQASTLYNISVQPICAGGGATGDATATGTTLTPICNPVTNATTSNVTANSLDVTFTPGTNNTSYTVTYGPTGGTTLTIPVTASPFSLTGLTPLTEYTIVITPICANGGTSAGTTVVVTTGAPVCNPVTNLAATSVTATSMSVAFTAGTGNTSFAMTYQAAGGPVQTVPSPVTSPVTLTGLTAGTVYTLTVTPVCAGGGTAAPTTITVTTACGSVGPVTVSSITSTSASVSFTTSPTSTAYTVTYQAAGGPVQTLPGTTTASPVVLTGLTPSTSYTIQVTPVCGGSSTTAQGTASFSTPLSTRTALGKGTLTVFPNPASRSATLAVPALSTSVRTATLEISNTLGQVLRHQSLTLNSNGTQTALDLTGLASGVYQVRVNAGEQTAIVRLVVE